MSVCEVVGYIKKKHRKMISEQTIYTWISRGRKNASGYVKRLKTNQIGWHAPHIILVEDVDAFLLWLAESSS